MQQQTKKHDDRVRVERDHVGQPIEQEDPDGEIDEGWMPAEPAFRFPGDSDLGAQGAPMTSDAPGYGGAISGGDEEEDDDDD